MAFSDKKAYIHTTREGKEKESLLQTSVLINLLLCAKMNLKIKIVDAAERIKETKMKFTDNNTVRVGEKLRVGAVNWDCSLSSDTYFGSFQTRTLSPEKYRRWTP
jgi:predicted metal-binding transcription factor (methanogenesis marker protein 9)